MQVTTFSARRFEPNERTNVRSVERRERFQMNREKERERRGNTARWKKGAAGKKKERGRKEKKERKEKNNGKSGAPIKKEEGKRRDSSVYYRFAEPVIIAGPRNAHRRPLILPLAILFSSLLIPHLSSGSFLSFFRPCRTLYSCASPRPVPSSISADSIIIINLFPKHPLPFLPPPLFPRFVPLFLFFSFSLPPSFCSYRAGIVLPLILFLLGAARACAIRG